MNVIKGSDFVNLFSALNQLNEFARFMSIRSATLHALEHSVSRDDMRLLLKAWLHATEPRLEAPPAADAVDPQGDSNTGTPTTRD